MRYCCGKLESRTGSILKLQNLQIQNCNATKTCKIACTNEICKHIDPLLGLYVTKPLQMDRYGKFNTI